MVDDNSVLREKRFTSEVENSSEDCCDKYFNPLKQ